MWILGLDFGEILRGNPGEIPHIAWKIRGV